MCGVGSKLTTQTMPTCVGVWRKLITQTMPMCVRVGSKLSNCRYFLCKKTCSRISVGLKLIIYVWAVLCNKISNDVGGIKINCFAQKCAGMLVGQNKLRVCKNNVLGCGWDLNKQLLPKQFARMYTSVSK